MNIDDYQNTENENEEYQGENQNFLVNFYNSNKKLVWILGGVLIIFLVIVLFPGGGEEKPAEEIPNLLLSNTKQNVNIDNNVKLIASVTNYPTGMIMWSSSDETIATVDTTGLVRGHKYGTTIITATYTHTDGKVYTKTCEVVVSEGNPDVELYEVNFPDGEIMIGVGGEFTIPLMVSPTDGYISDIKYTTDNSSVVTIDEKGKIKALSVGKTLAKVSVNNGKFTDEIVVNVVLENVLPQVVINPTSILFDKDVLELEIGQNRQLTYTVLPVNASATNLIWESSDPTVVTVGNGIITTLKKGIAVITVKTLTGISDTITINVIEKVIPVEAVSVIESYVMLTKGSTHQIVASVIPEDATNKTIRYSSDNTSIATVSATGLVTAINNGTATITVTSEEGNMTTSVTINVGTTSGGSSGGSGGSSIKVKEIKPTSPSMVVLQGKKITITPTISPSNASNKKVDCVSSNSAIVKVTASGSSCNATAVGLGNATITIKAKDGSGKQATVNVTVNKYDVSKCTAWKIVSQREVTSCSNVNSENCTDCLNFTKCQLNIRYKYSVLVQCNFVNDVTTNTLQSGYVFTSRANAMNACDSNYANYSCGGIPIGDYPKKSTTGCVISSQTIYTELKYTRTCQ